MIDLVQKILKGSKSLDGGLRLWELFPSSQLNLFTEHYSQFSNLAQTYISKAIVRSPEDKGTSVVQDLASSGCDQETISTIAADLMFGGVDTTAHTSMFVLYLLAVNPDKQEILHSQLQDQEGVESPYLRAVLKESMRLLPPAP